jgi:hypothetical protein
MALLPRGPCCSTLVCSYVLVCLCVCVCVCVCVFVSCPCGFRFLTLFFFQISEGTALWGSGRTSQNAASRAEAVSSARSASCSVVLKRAASALLSSAPWPATPTPAPTRHPVGKRANLRVPPLSLSLPFSLFPSPLTLSPCSSQWSLPSTVSCRTGSASGRARQ